MIDIGVLLRHYKRPEIQQAMVEASRDREVAVRFGDKGFGKRPDMLSYPNDVLEFAKQRSTSFHTSEERWRNVLQLNPGLKPKELDDLRIGWDLILDIDIPDWKLSKIITWLLIEALKQHEIFSISIKFSGNKGFHIGVPYEAFPKMIDGKDSAKMFPDICKQISLYLIDYIAKTMISVDGDKVTFNSQYTLTLDYIAEKIGKSKDELIETRCVKCDKKVKRKKTQKYQFICPACEHTEKSDKGYMTCPKCSTIMEKMSIKREDEKCSCGSEEVYNAFNAMAVVEVDTILISSRHMYRLVYSLHEKSGLASIPFDPDKVLFFKKDMAKPELIKAEDVEKIKFLDTTNTRENEGQLLVDKALGFNAEDRLLEEKREQFVNYEKETKKMTEFEELENAVPPEFFPPCIVKILQGMEDGKKRAMFILSNFFSNTGHSWEETQEQMTEWNNKNPEPLREVLITGQIRYRKRQKKKVMPPNCDNKAYYKDMQCCIPDAFCQRIKNPVNYAVLKAKIASGTGKKGRQKLTEEQKAMRREFRQKQKEEKEHKEKPNKENKNQSKEDNKSKE